MPSYHIIYLNHITILADSTQQLPVAVGSVESVEGVDDDVPVQAQDCNWGSLFDERKQLLQSTEMYLTVQDTRVKKV